MKKFFENAVGYVFVFGLIIWAVGIDNFIRGIAVVVGLWIVIEMIADRVSDKLRQ